MPKIKLTKGELKRQRDALKQYRRFLPTLQLKKQQLQIEILSAVSHLEDKRSRDLAKTHEAEKWAGLLSDGSIEMARLIKPIEIKSTSRNIAGVDIPVFESVEYKKTEYDLFLTPLWVDAAIDSLRQLLSLRKEIGIIEESIEILKRELRVTTQRVNLFEKVKIPQAQEAIRLIKIHIGDQMTNAVGRSKMAKKKIEELAAEGAIA